MGDRSAEMINIAIAIIAVVALMSIGFAIFTISKRLGNESQNDLVNQLNGISNSVYTDLNQQTVTGARLKGVVNQVSTGDCAILVGTLGLFGSEVSLGSVVQAEDKENNAITNGKAEATLNGNLAMDMKDGFAPMCQLNDYSVKTALGTTLKSPYLVNYGSVLKNSVLRVAETEEEKSKDADKVFSTVTLKNGKLTANASTAYSGGPVEYNQAIGFKDGIFTSKLEFATNPINSKIIRYDNTADFTNKGKTCYIPDTSIYSSYVLKNASGDYMGLIFVQMRK